jgi:hypothetical protein
MIHTVECLPSKHEALGPGVQTPVFKKKKKILYTSFKKVCFGKLIPTLKKDFKITKVAWKVAF